MLLHASKISKNNKELRKNKPIAEEFEEEKSPNRDCNRITQDFGENMKTPQSQSTVDNKIVGSKKTTSVNLGAMSSSHHSQVFKNEKEWFSIE